MRVSETLWSQTSPSVQPPHANRGVNSSEFNNRPSQPAACAGAESPACRHSAHVSSIDVASALGKPRLPRPVLPRQRARPACLHDADRSSRQTAATGIKFYAHKGKSVGDEEAAKRTAVDFSIG